MRRSTFTGSSPKGIHASKLDACTDVCLPAASNADFQATVMRAWNMLCSQTCGEGEWPGSPALKREPQQGIQTILV